MGKLLSKCISPSIFSWDLSNFDHMNISKDTDEAGKESCTCDWHPYPSELISDVTIRVEDRTFHARKDVLSYFSPVLKDFLEKTDTSKAVEILLHYMYTADLKMNCQNIVDIYKSSQKLRIKDVMFKCIQIIRSENTAAFIYKYTASMQLGLSKERFKSYKVILWHLEECIENKELLDLHAGQMCEILTGAGMPCVKTNIRRFQYLYMQISGIMDRPAETAMHYYTLFLVAVEWLEYKQAERWKQVVVVMCSVPFRRMTKEEILQCLFSKSASHIVEVPGVKRIILSSLSELSTKEFIMEISKEEQN